GVPGTTRGGGRGERERHRRDALARGLRDPATPPLRVEAERVHDRRQPAPQARLHDRVEQRERVRRGGQVVLRLAYAAPQPVARADPAGRERRLRPGALARPRRPDEHHQGRRRKPHVPIVPHWQPMAVATRSIALLFAVSYLARVPVTAIT